MEGDGRVVPGGVGLERPPHQRCAGGVDLDGADLAAEFVAFGDVEVADGGFAVGAAGDRLLRHALGDLVGEVAAVELGDRGHDAVHQHPRRRLVDVLCRRHQDHAGVFEREVDRDVVGTVAGEAVDLVDDAVGHMVLLDVLDHPHQLGPVRGLRRRPSVDELFDDDGAQVSCFAEVRFALGGDGEAFVASAAFGLFLGRDAQVGHGESGGLTDPFPVGVGRRLSGESVRAGRCRWVLGACGCSDGHGSCFLSPIDAGPARAGGCLRVRCDS
nr:hypothetical protein [Cumulibacter soli]